MKDYVGLSRVHFDEQAKDYDDKDTVYYSKYPKISCKDVADRLKKMDYQNLLDVGCGTGYLIELLQKERKADYYGLDLSPAMLWKARQKFKDTVFLTEGESDHLPYEDNMFDVVTCIQSFHHYPYPGKAMKEAYRVLKPGGFYILSDTGMGGIAKWFYNHLFLKGMNSGDYAVYSREDIRKLMEANGFKSCGDWNIAKMIYTVIGRK